MRQQISILVPFKADGSYRAGVWRWLTEYWQTELPHAEIIVGYDHNAKNGRSFSKTSAVNNAFRRSHGDIIVILDADAYFDSSVIEHCAHRLRTARDHGARTWFVPYTHMYRLTESATMDVLFSHPRCPLRFSSPPPPEDVDGQQGSWGPGTANSYGALVQIMPREAFEEVGCMDYRFRGWGGEDVSFLRALDTLWGRHKNTPNDVLHLWHPKLHTIGFDPTNQYLTRIWGGQMGPGANNSLATQYHLATWQPVRMRKLVDSGCRRTFWQRMLERLQDAWIKYRRALMYIGLGAAIIIAVILLILFL